MNEELVKTAEAAKYLFLNKIITRDEYKNEIDKIRAALHREPLSQTQFNDLEKRIVR